MRYCITFTGNPYISLRTLVAYGHPCDITELVLYDVWGIILLF